MEIEAGLLFFEFSDEFGSLVFYHTAFAGVEPEYPERNDYGDTRCAEDDQEAEYFVN